MANTKITTNVIADDAVTSDKLGGDLTMPGHVSLADNKELRIGTGNDLVIKHDGSHTTLTNTTGNFTLLGDAVYIGNAANNEYLAQFIANGAASLRYDNTEQLATITNGVYVPNKLGVGTNSLTRELTVKLNGQADISIVAATNQYAQLLFGDTDADNKGIVGYNNTTDILEFWTSGSNRMAIDSGGNVGIGTASPAEMLEIYNTTSPAIQLNDGGEYQAIMRLAGNDLELRSSSGNMEFYTGNVDGDSSAERLRITSNGTFLLGTTATRVMSGVGPKFFIEGTDYATSSMGIVINANGANDCPALFFGKSRGTSDGSNTVVQNGDRVFSMRMDGSDGTNLEQVAIIEAHVDAAPAANSIPGRMTFMTTNTGNQYATEKMRIDNGGRVTMPSQPVAIYGHTSGTEAGGYSYNWGSTGSVGVICNPQNALLNRGSMFNTSNGRFTAPVAGVYRYAVHGNLYTLYVADGAYTMIQIRKNGSHYVYHYHNNEANSSSWFYHNMGGLISMAKDDYLEFRLVSNNMSGGSSGGFGWDASNYTHYEFQLLY